MGSAARQDPAPRTRLLSYRAPRHGKTLHHERDYYLTVLRGTARPCTTNATTILPCSATRQDPAPRTRLLSYRARRHGKTLHHERDSYLTVLGGTARPCTTNATTILPCSAPRQDPAQRTRLL